LWDPEHSAFFDKEKYLLPLPGIGLNQLLNKWNYIFSQFPYLALLENQ